MRPYRYGRFCVRSSDSNFIPVSQTGRTAKSYLEVGDLLAKLTAPGFYELGDLTPSANWRPRLGFREP